MLSILNRLSLKENKSYSFYLVIIAYMKLTIRKTILLIFVTLNSCTTSSEYFIGKWQILNVVENNKTVELVENWIHIKSDGTFESYDGNLKKNESGTWTYQFERKKIVHRW